MHNTSRPTATDRTETKMASHSSSNSIYCKQQHHHLNHINVRCLCYVILAIYTQWTECFTLFGVHAAIELSAAGSTAGHISGHNHQQQQQHSSHQQQYHQIHATATANEATAAQQSSSTQPSSSSASQPSATHDHFNGREPLRLDDPRTTSAQIPPQFNVDYLLRQQQHYTGNDGNDVSVTQHLHFEPSAIVFDEVPVGNSRTEKVMLFNRHPNQSAYIGPIDGLLPDFYSSFFRDEVKIVQPMGNTTFNVVFLPRQVGLIVTTLQVHTTLGVVMFELRGSAVVCPFRLQPLTGIRAPLNTTLTPEIIMYNPFEQPLHVLEAFTSGGNFQLEMLRGNLDGEVQGRWQIPAYTERAVVRVRFHAFQSGMHAAYVRIIVLVDEDSTVSDMELVVPIEIEVTDHPSSLFLEQPMLNFGRGGRSDKPKRLLINLTGSDPDSIARSSSFMFSSASTIATDDAAPSIQSFAIEGDAGLIDAITLRLHKSAASSIQERQEPTTKKQQQRTTATAAAATATNTESHRPAPPSLTIASALDEPQIDAMSATLDWSMLSMKQQIFRGHIAIRTLLSNNREANLRIALVAEALDGAMFYNESHTQFVTPTKKTAADASESMSTPTRTSTKSITAQQRPFTVRNDFAVPLAITNVTLSADASPYFRLSDVTSQLLAPGSESAIARIGLQAAALQQRHAVAGHMMVHTNASVYAVRLSTYNGRLRRIVPVDERTHAGRGVDEQIINYGTLPLSTVTDTVVAFVNDNPVPVTLHNWTATISDAASIFVLLRGCGPLSMDGLKFCYNVQPGEWIVFQVSVLSNAVGTFIGRLTMKTDFEELLTPVQFSTAVGRLQITATETHLQSCFPGGICTLNVTAHSTFVQPISVRDIQVNVTDDITYDYSAALLQHLPPIAPNKMTPVVLLHFLPRALCGDECALQLPDRWAPSVISHNCKHQLPDLMHEKLQEFRRIRAAFAALAVRVQTNQVRRYDFNASATMLWPKLVTFPTSGAAASMHRQRQHQQHHHHQRRVIEANAYEPDVQGANNNNDIGTSEADATLSSSATTTATNTQRTGPIEFPTFQVGEEVLRIVEITNPTDRPIAVHLMLHDIARHGTAMSFPPEVMSLCWDCFLSREPVFALVDTAAVRPAEVQVIAPRASLPVTVRFSTATAGQYSTLLYVRNNFTILEAVWLTAKAAAHQFKFGNRKPGSDTPLVFELTDKHFRDCDRGHSVRNSNEYPVYPVTPIMEEMMSVLNAGFGFDEGAGDGSVDGGGADGGEIGGSGATGASTTGHFTGGSSTTASNTDSESEHYAGRVRVVAKRTFTAKNTGDMAIDIYGMYIEGMKCAGYGFKVMNCWNFRLPPDTTKKIDITFTPDFTLARVTRVLSIETSLNYPINYTLLSLVPAQALNTCGKAIRRPVWEYRMHLATFLMLIIALLLVACMSFFEADRVLKLHVYNVSRDRGPMEPPLNLREIGLRNPTMSVEDSSSSNGAKAKAAASASSSCVRKRSNKRPDPVEPPVAGAAVVAAAVLQQQPSGLNTAAVVEPSSNNQRGGGVAADRKAESAAKRNVVALMDANLPGQAATGTVTSSPNRPADQSTKSTASTLPSNSSSASLPSSGFGIGSGSPPTLVTKQSRSTTQQQHTAGATAAAAASKKPMQSPTSDSVGGGATAAATTSSSIANAVDTMPTSTASSSFQSNNSTIVHTSPTASSSSVANNHNNSKAKTKAAVKKTKSLPLQPAAATLATTSAKDGMPATGSQTSYNAKVGKQHTMTEPTPKQPNIRSTNNASTSSTSSTNNVPSTQSNNTNRSSTGGNNADTPSSKDKTQKQHASGSTVASSGSSRSKESPPKDSHHRVPAASLSATAGAAGGAAAAVTDAVQTKSASSSSSLASSTSSSASSSSEAEKPVLAVPPEAAPAKKYGKTPGRERRKEQQAAAAQPVTRKQNLSTLLMSGNVSNEPNSRISQSTNSNTSYKGNNAFQFGAPPLNLAPPPAPTTAPQQLLNFAAPPSSSLAAASSSLWDMNRTSFSNIVAQSSLVAASASVYRSAETTQAPSQPSSVVISAAAGDDGNGANAGAGDANVVDNKKTSNNDAKPPLSATALSRAQTSIGTESIVASTSTSSTATSVNLSTSTPLIGYPVVSENAAGKIPKDMSTSTTAPQSVTSQSAPTLAHSATGDQSNNRSSSDASNLLLLQSNSISCIGADKGAGAKNQAAAVADGAGGAFVVDNILTGVDLGPIGTRKSPAQTPVVWESMQASVHKPLTKDLSATGSSNILNTSNNNHNTSSSSIGNGAVGSANRSSDSNITYNPNSFFSSNFPQGAHGGNMADHTDSSIFDLDTMPTNAAAAAASLQMGGKLNLSQLSDLLANARNMGFSGTKQSVWDTPMSTLGMINQSDMNNSRQQQQQQNQLRQQQQLQQMQQLQQQQQLMLQHQQQIQNDAMAHQQQQSQSSQLSNNFGTIAGLLNATQFGQSSAMINAYGNHNQQLQQQQQLLLQQQILQPQQQQQQQQHLQYGSGNADLLHQQRATGSGAATTTSTTFDTNQLWSSNFNASSTPAVPDQFNSWNAASSNVMMQEPVMNTSATIRPPPGLERQSYPNRLFNQQQLLQQQLLQQQYIQQQEQQLHLQQQQLQQQQQHLQQLHQLNAPEPIILLQHTLNLQQQQQQQSNINSGGVNNMTDNAIFGGGGGDCSSAMGRNNGNATVGRSAIGGSNNSNNSINDKSGGSNNSNANNNMYNTFGSIWSPPSTWDTPLRPSTSSASLNSTHSSSLSTSGGAAGVGGASGHTSPPPPTMPSSQDYNSRMQ